MIHFDSRFGEAKTNTYATAVRTDLPYVRRQPGGKLDGEAKSTAGVSPTSHQNAAAQPLLIEVNMGMGQYL